MANNECSKMSDINAYTATGKKEKLFWFWSWGTIKEKDWLCFPEERVL